jgi:hypothetical protein
VKDQPGQLQVELSGSLSIAASSTESRSETDLLEYLHVYVNGAVASATEIQAVDVTEKDDQWCWNWSCSTTTPAPENRDERTRTEAIVARDQTMGGRRVKSKTWRCKWIFAVVIASLSGKQLQHTKSINLVSPIQVPWYWRYACMFGAGLKASKPASLIESASSRSSSRNRPQMTHAGESRLQRILPSSPCFSVKVVHFFAKDIFLL